MQRTKQPKPKLRRTKPTKAAKMNNNQPPHKEFGGHLPDPPADCTARRPFIGQDGTEYVDMCSCGHCTRKHCDRYRQHCKDMNEWFRQRHQAIEARKVPKQKKRK